MKATNKNNQDNLSINNLDFNHYVKYQMQVVNSADIDIDTYQRERKEKKVDRIVAEFDEYIANEPKLSYRDGKYYAFDGQHTIAARVKMNGNMPCNIVCKVFFDLTPEREAQLFAKQTGTSTKLSSGVHLRAMVIGKDKESLDFIKANKSVGIQPSYLNASGSSRLRCINTAFHSYRSVGEKCYKEAMGTIMIAWKGKPSSLLAEVVQSMCTFAKIYDGEYCPHKLGDILSYTDPYDIVRAYKEPGKEGGLKNALSLILHYYNSSSSERPLPVKF